MNASSSFASRGPGPNNLYLRPLARRCATQFQLLNQITLEGYAPSKHSGYDTDPNLELPRPSSTVPVTCADQWQVGAWLLPIYLLYSSLFFAILMEAREWVIANPMALGLIETTCVFRLDHWPTTLTVARRMLCRPFQLRHPIRF